MNVAIIIVIILFQIIFESSLGDDQTRSSPSPPTYISLDSIGKKNTFQRQPSQSKSETSYKINKFLKNLKQIVNKPVIYNEEKFNEENRRQK
ncbi:hypothetical protein ACQ4LE_005981 [Meloidogyne hapla]|uniref:Uncharacterized protein n=1 Tax=Meloidogyne hapla TaxID=6305 RepID=A0A1I8AZE2_MELHA